MHTSNLQVGRLPTGVSYQILSEGWQHVCPCQKMPRTSVSAQVRELRLEPEPGQLCRRTQSPQMILLIDLHRMFLQLPPFITRLMF